MRPSARIVTLGLAFAPLMLAASRVDAGGGGEAPTVQCAPAQGVDMVQADALCDALRAQDPKGGMRLRVLATGPTALSEQLDRVTDQGDRPGQRMDFSVTDRDLQPDDFTSFARDLLRYGLPD